MNLMRGRIKHSVLIGFLTLSLLNSVCYSENSQPSAKTTSTPASNITVQASSQTYSQAPISNDDRVSRAHLQYQDINLSQGAVSFSEEDLRLPGKNGLDLVISRTYNSRNFLNSDRINEISSKSWSGWSTTGWSFNFGMRVFYASTSQNSSKKRMIVDRGGDLEQFTYESGSINSGEGEIYRSKTPGSKAKLTWRLYGQDNFPIVLITEDGTRYTFNTPACSFSSKNLSGGGAYLDSISDTYGNTITILYQTFMGSSLSQRGVRLPQIIGKDIYDSAGGNTTEDVLNIELKRPVRIIDTFNRTLVIDYEYQNTSGYSNEPLNHSQEYSFNKTRVCKITYPNTNGGSSFINYSYADISSNGLSLGTALTSVQSGALPATNYTYSNYFPQTSDIQGLISGLLLQTISTSLGSKITYTFSDDYQLDDHTIREIIPVITNKKIEANNGSGETYTYSFIYPNNASTGRPLKASFTPPNAWDPDTKFYYFSTVTVDNPSLILDETYTFDQSLPTRYTKGILSTETIWDFTQNRQTQVTQKKNGTTQSVTKYLAFDSYNNPTQIVTQKGSLDYIRQDMTYWNDTGFISQNLIHLPKTTTVTDLTTGIKRYSYTTYTPQGKVYESYEGQDASGRKLATLTYDTNGRVLTQTQYGPGGTLTMQYSYALGSSYILTQTLNGKTAQSIYEINTGKLISSTDPNNAVTTYTYDAYGRPTQVTYPNGQTEQYSYSTDLKTTTITSGGRTVVSKIDNLGRTVEIDNPSGEDNIKYAYYYGDTPSTIYKQSGGIGGWIQKKSYTYDSYLRKLTSTSVDFGTVTYAYNDTANTVSVTDPLGRTTTTQTDELGRNIQTQFVPDSSITSSTYDAFGNVLTVTDPRNLVHKTDYDAYGRPITEYHSSTTPLNRRTQLTYTAGEITQVQQFSTGNVLFRTFGSTYDTEGRLTTTSLGGTSVETLTYDESSQENSKGHLTKADNADSQTRYDYDNIGRIKRETTTIKPISKTVAINYTYNSTNGNLASYSYPDGKAVTYTYDSNQRVKTMSYNGKLLVTYTYNSNGTLQTMTYGNNTQITYTYEKEVLLKTLTTTLYTQSYTYDAVGRATQTQHTDYFTGSGNLTRDYTYTPKNELKTVAINSTPTYTNNYDKNSNHLRLETQHNKGLTGDNMIIDPTNDHLIQKTYKDNKKVTFTYDPAGNMLQKNRTWADGSQGPKLAYTYNYQDQLTQASNTGSTTMTAAYDHKNQRIYTNMPGPYPWNGQKFYYWDQSGHIIGEGKVGVNDYVTRYFYSGNQKIAMERYDQTTGISSFYYFINNAQGTSVLITDEQNNPVSKINLDEWGNVGDKTSGPQQEINFTGKKLDIPTGLYYFNQRYYDPEIGRFINEDPAGQGLNQYAYCGNNPLMYTDPDGQFFLPMLWAALSYATAKTATKFVDNLAHGRSNDLTSLGDEFKNAGIESLKKQTGLDKVEDAYNKAKDVATLKLPKIELPSVKLPNVDMPRIHLPQSISMPSNVNMSLCGFQTSFKNFYLEKISMSYPVLDKHYFRNQYNQPKLATMEMSYKKSVLHHFGPGGEKNKKYISLDGHNEAVYGQNGKLVGGLNMGTYNYYSPEGIEGFVHFGVDVLPFIMFGN